MSATLGCDLADVILDMVERFSREHPPLKKRCVLMREATARELRARVREIDEVYNLHVVPAVAMPGTFVVMEIYGGDPARCPICGREGRAP